MSIKKLAVLSMLVVMLVAFNTPASAQFAGAAGISATSLSSFSASSTSFGSFGGFGFPFNWGFIPFGVGNFPFNWALGGGFGPFPLLNTFGGGFGGLCGLSSPCLPASMPMIGANAPLGGLAKGIAKASIDQAVPFILGSPLGGSPLLGFGMTPWAFGTQSCVNNFPLYLGAHGFGFPFTLGNYRIGFTPSCGLPCAPPCLPAAIPAIPPMGANAPLGGLAKGIAKASIDQAVPFILGSPLGGSPLLGFGMTPWAFGTQSCVNNFPLYLGAHGFGFPFTLGNYRIGFTPSCGLPCAPPCLPGCLPGLSGAPIIGGANAPFTMPAANAAIGK
jgi:hypothetical protein